jgi:hypothetical protein
MKMKKTIATVMAAMTAVSAMAATVSADQAEINLTYDLRTKVTTIDAGRGLFTQQFTAVQGTPGAKDMYTASPESAYVSLSSQGGAWTPVAFLRFGANNNGGFKDKVKEATFTFNLTNKDSQDKAHPNLSQTIKFTTDFEKVAADPTWIYVNEDDGLVDIDGDGVREFKVFDGYFVDIPVSFGALVATNADGVAIYNPIVNYFNLSSYDLGDYNYDATMYQTIKAYNPIIASIEKDLGFNSVTANIQYETEGFVNQSQLNGWAFWGAHDGEVNPNGVYVFKQNGEYYPNYFDELELAWLGIDYAQETAVNSQYLTKGLVGKTTAVWQGRPAGEDEEGVAVNVQGIIGASVAKAGAKKEHIYPLLSTSKVYDYYSTSKGWAYQDGKLVPVYDIISTNAISSTKDVQVQAGVDDNGDPIMVTVTVPVISTNYEVQTKPKSTSGNQLLTTNDVIGAIRRSGSGTSPLSVINDAIANDYDVEFTFTSASGYVATTATNAVLQWVNAHEELTYPVINAWSKATFGQHLYSSAYNNVSSPYSGASFDPAYSLSANAATDMYGSFSSAWAQNLVSAGLVVNSELTMQLNDVQKLQWDQSKLTFHWDDVIDGKVTRVNQVLTTMLLYTPVDWYWDTLEVKVLKTEEVEDVTAGESLEEEGEDLEEEVVDEEEDFVDEEPEDEPEEEPEDEDFDIPEEPEEPEAPEAPAEVVAPVAASPKTGNAPIALAVIPVALAAAAVVAKKRG